LLARALLALQKQAKQLTLRQAWQWFQMQEITQRETP